MTREQIRARARKLAGRDDWTTICAEVRQTQGLATEYVEHLASFDEKNTMNERVIPQAEQCTLNAEDWSQAERDAGEIATRLIGAPKRKFAPTYSVPSEILIMILCPHYISKPAPDLGGIGGRRDHREGMRERLQFEKWKRDKPSLTTLRGMVGPRKRLVKLLAHVRATWKLPSQASISTAFLLDKKKMIRGPKGIRITHIFCPFWRSLLRAAVLKGSEFDAPAWAHGGVKGRRREGLMLNVRIATHRLRRAKLPHAVKSYDATSAFHSGELKDLHEVIQKRLRYEQRTALGADPHDARLARQDEALLQQRRYNAVMSIPCPDGTAYLRAREGGLMGDSNEPEAFMGNYHIAVNKYRMDTHSRIAKPLIAQLEWLQVKGDASMGSFLDDIIRTVTADDGDARTLAWLCNHDANKLDEALTDRG